jgi:hypothetical protein
MSNGHDIDPRAGTDQYPARTDEYPRLDHDRSSSQGDRTAEVDSDAPWRDPDPALPWDEADPAARAVVDHLLEHGDDRQRWEAELARDFWFMNVRNRGKALADEYLRSFVRSPGILRSHRRQLPEASTVPTPELPAKRGGVTSNQVGVKLAAEDFRRLRRAAQVYGLPPSTLARLLVNRGVNAILLAEGSAREV